MKKILVLILVFIGLGAYYLSSNKDAEVNTASEVSEEAQGEQAEKDGHDHNHSDVVKTKNITTKSSIKKPNFDKAAPNPFKPKNNDEKSLDSLTDLVVNALDAKNDSKNFRDRLKEHNLIPVTAFDKNPYTGKMTIIRTKENLPGTRYVHAQYFENEDGSESLQHLSYEYRPGPNALPRAVEAIKAKLDIRKEPTTVKDDFVGWTLDNGYVVWCMTMGLTHLKDDPFNAYSPKDVGTIRCATELDIHEGGVGDHPGE